MYTVMTISDFNFIPLGNKIIFIDINIRGAYFTLGIQPLQLYSQQASDIYLLEMNNIKIAFSN